MANGLRFAAQIKDKIGFRDKLRRFTTNFEREAHLPYVMKTMNDSIAELQQYPPETGANRPPVPYYIRGVGKQITSITNLNNSEQMKTRWKTAIKRLSTRIDGLLANSASYSGWVHGPKQMWFHAMRDWKEAIGVLNRHAEINLDRPEAWIRDYFE